MKIVLVSGIYFPDIGGPATYLPSLAHGLINRGYEVTVVSLTDSQDSSRPDEPWKRIFIPRRINKFIRTYMLIKAIRIEAKQSSFVFSNGLFLETALSTVGLNCVTTAKIVGDPVWERVKNKGGTKYSIEEFGQRFSSISSLIHRKIVNFSLNRFDKLTAPGNSLANNIRDWGVKKRIRVIPNGVRCIDVEETIKEYDVISLARLVTWKRINLLIEACAIANLKLAVVGDGPEKENLQSLALATGCNATFFGQLDRRESIELLRRSSIFALLSSYEGLSFALVEAMMLETKILVSDAPGNIGVIDDGIEGFLIKEYSPYEIAKKLEEINKDEAYLDSMRCRARKKAQSFFCEENQVNAMINLVLASI
jgi:glycosyltransferase involved in cell wall biosynthesis